MRIFARLAPFLFETPDDTGGGATPPAPEQDPAPAPAAQPPATTPPAPVSPWAADLAAVVTDDDTRAAVDQYLRSNWQPRMTQFEQQVAEAAPALELVNDFRSDPVATFQAVANEIWSDDPQMVARITAAFAQEQQPAAPPTPPADSTPRDPEVEEMLADYQAQQREKAWDDAIVALKAAHPEDPTISGPTLSPFVITADGNFELAYQGYRRFIAELQQAHGLTTPQAEAAAAAQAAQAATTAPPPPSLGTAESSPSTPPVQKRHASLDDALDEFLDEQRSARQPTAQPVGVI